MAKSNPQQFFPIDCPVCTEPASDPRLLPCGHAYCGPPNTCLAVVQKKNGLTCFLCKENFDMQVSQLKPLLDIELEFLEHSNCKSHQRYQNTNSFEALCENHIDKPVKFWCLSCETKACEECFEIEHETHSLMSFRSYLKQEFGPSYEILLSGFETNSQENGTGSLNTTGNSNSIELNKLTHQRKDGKVMGNSNGDESLNFVESFIGNSFDYFTKLEKGLKMMTLSTPPNLTFRSESTFVCKQQQVSASTNDPEIEIGQMRLPYTNFAVEFTFYCRIEIPTFIILTKVSKQMEKNGISKRNCYLGKCFINFPTLLIQRNWSIDGKLVKAKEEMHNFEIVLTNAQINGPLLYNFQSDFFFK